MHSDDEKSYGIGAENIKAFMKFLFLKGLAHKDNKGVYTATNILSDEFFDALKEFNEAYANTPPISVTPKRAKNVTVEVTKAGRELRDKNILPLLYDGGEMFRTGETRSKKPQPVKTVLSLSFEELDEWKIHIPAHKQIIRADIERAIHATTLYLTGNTVITTDMLFRQMNGENAGKPTDAWRKDTYDSFSRLGQTWITIDTTQEVKAGYNDTPQYRGALLPCSMIIGGNITIQGKQVRDAIKIYDISPLIKYALAKGQVSEIPIEMFNIPKLHSTDENIELIGYMTRAFASMRNGKSNVKPVILCKTVYEYLGVAESVQQNKTENKQRKTAKVKAKIREAIKTILTAWKNSKFIKDFQELGVDGKPARKRKGVTVAKFELELFTPEELKKFHENEENSLA